MGGGIESVCLGLRSLVDSLALNKALNANIKVFFSSVLACGLTSSFCFMALNSLSLRLSLSTNFKNYKEVYALNYENVISLLQSKDTEGRLMLSVIYLPVEEAKLEKKRGQKVRDFTGGPIPKCRHFYSN